MTGCSSPDLKRCGGRVLEARYGPRRAAHLPVGERRGRPLQRPAAAITCTHLRISSDIVCGDKIDRVALLKSRICAC